MWSKGRNGKYWSTMKEVNPAGSCNFSSPWWIMSTPAETRRMSKHKSEESDVDVSSLMTFYGKNLTILHLFKAWPPGAVIDENCRWVALVKPSLVLTSSTCLIWMKRENLNRSNQSNCKSAIGKTTVDQTNPRFSKYETSRGDRRCRQLVAKHQNENKTLYESRETTIRLATSINQHTT